MWFVGMIVGMLVGSLFGVFGGLWGAMLGIWLGIKWGGSSHDATPQYTQKEANTASREYRANEETDDTLYDPVMERRIASLERQVTQLSVRMKQLERASRVAPSVDDPASSAAANTQRTVSAADFMPTAPTLTTALQTDQNIEASRRAPSFDVSASPVSDAPELLIVPASVAFEPTPPPCAPELLAQIATQPSLDAAEKLPTPVAAVTPAARVHPSAEVVHPPIRAAIRPQYVTQTVAQVEAAPVSPKAEKTEAIPLKKEVSPIPSPRVPEVNTPPAGPSIWAKLFGGNILAKIGVVILFFAVASALKLAVEHGMFPIQVRLLLGAAGAVGMVLFGWSRAQTEKHQMFGFALQGGAFAILYLIVYFMLTRYAMITPTWAFIGYTLLGVSCTLMAAKQNSVSLAILGISGAFLSPVLAANNGGSHITLFSYFALLNVFVFALNWFKAWRQLNIIGFLFTLGIGMNWALSAYQPAYLGSTEFFLVLFFLIYSLEPVCYALFRQSVAMQWGDGLLLFGTPTVVVASQAVLMRPFEYGQAWSVFVMGLYYLALWGGLYRKNDETLKLSERSHLGIALTLLTYTVPLAFGAQITAAVWTIEGCAVLWLGISQERYLARWTGIALQVLAGGYFYKHLDQLSHTHAVFNDVYIGSVIVALTGMISGLMLHRWEKKNNQLSADALFAWGAIWLVVASWVEIDWFVLVEYQHSAWLSLFVLAVLCSEIGGKHWIWRSLRTTLPLALALAVIAFDSIMQHQHVLTGALTLVYPAAVALYYWLLTRQERDDISKGLARAAMFWGLSVLVSNEVAWVVQHYLAPQPALWYWLPFGITLASISLWRGIRQDEPLARLLGMAAQVGVGVYLVENYADISHAPAIYNDFFLSSMLLAIAAWAAAWTLHRKNPASRLPDMLFYWGFAWLVLPVCLEIAHFASMATADAAWLSFFAVLVALLEWVGKRENWAALRQMISVAFVAIIVVAADATFQAHHVLHGMLIPVFPVALALYYWQLARHEQDQFNVGLPALHLGMFWGVAALVSHEISWGIQRLTPNNDLWHILAYGGSFALITLGTLKAHAHKIFPTTTLHANYVTHGLIPVIFASVAWFALANVGYSGSGSGLPYLPVLNPLDLAMLLSLFSIYQWISSPQPEALKRLLMYMLPAAAFLWVSTLAARLAHNWGGVPFDWGILAHNPIMHALLSVIWTLASIVMMIYASRQQSRKVWFIGFGLLAVVGAKLMLVDLRNTGTITWTASLFGIALLVIAASYFSPAPPKKEEGGGWRA